MLNNNNEFRLDFIGIGEAKSGTTWVADVLRKHPEVYYPEARKELWYFNSRLPFDHKTANPSYGKPYSWYHEFFKNAKEGQICGEITPSYLGMENTCADIYKYNPDVKLFAVLREPVSRSFSQFLFSLQNGMSEEKTFEEAIANNPEKFLNTSFYAKNLQRFYDTFPKEQIKILFFDDLKNDKAAFLKELYEFLGVANFFEEEMNEKVNEGQQLKNKALGKLIGKAQKLAYHENLNFLIPMIKKTGIPALVKKVKNKNMETRSEKITINEDTKQRLKDLFLSDIQQLEQLTNRDLSHWK